MQVGDLVRLVSENELGIITSVVTDITDDPLDMMFPFHVLFADLGDDWFPESSLELISESR
jgi:hypothetical protein|tara:strand:+ start:1323 stop:1505 length:183 start_codon:yes stop_codon:yes gene_type:complete